MKMTSVLCLGDGETPPFNAIFITLQQTAVRHPWELGAGSIWFYGSRSLYATSSGILNGMAVCLMNRFKTQVSPRGCAISSFLSSIYAEEIMCNNNCLVPTGWPGRPAPFLVREQRKIYCSRLDFIFPLRLSHHPPLLRQAPTHPPPVRVVSLVFMPCRSDIIYTNISAVAAARRVWCQQQRSVTALCTGLAF